MNLQQRQRQFPDASHLVVGGYPLLDPHDPENEPVSMSMGDLQRNLQEAYDDGVGDEREQVVVSDKLRRERARDGAMCAAFLGFVVGILVEAAFHLLTSN